MSTTISLDDDVALVLFEMLASQQIEGGVPNLKAPERNALWGLQASLEKVLAEPFSPHYDELLQKARASVLERLGK
ncbi:MAG: hypothetical protein H7A20_07830 [Rhodanobacteraceae bacterium]|nr:hypothetical protein [Rhodanobacteraceae bacterium]HPF72035.1 hypothetical protein [Xanthomonadaceae bacterium]HRX98814.1 hypothetical protein [Xanthomonadaceae bacterium]